MISAVIGQKKEIGALALESAIFIQLVCTFIILKISGRGFYYIALISDTKLQRTLVDHSEFGGQICSSFPINNQIVFFGKQWEAQ
jgi:hypothetical protein